MAYQQLNIDKRFTVNGQKSHNNEDNVVKMHIYIQNFLKEFSKQLPVYANNAAALAGGLVEGDWYKTATGTIQTVV